MMLVMRAHYAHMCKYVVKCYFMELESLLRSNSSSIAHNVAESQLGQLGPTVEFCWMWLPRLAQMTVVQLVICGLPSISGALTGALGSAVLIIHQARGLASSRGQCFPSLCLCHICQPLTPDQLCKSDGHPDSNRLLS